MPDLAVEDEMLQSRAPDNEITSVLVMGAQALSSGDIERAQIHLEQAYESALARGDDSFYALLIALLGIVSMERGRIEQGIQRLQEARSSLDSTDTELPGTISGLISIARARLASQELETQLLDTQSLMRQELAQIAADSVETKRRHPIESEGAFKTAPADHLRPTRSPETAVALKVRLLGPFEARLDDGGHLALCPNRKGQAIFKILVSQPHRRLNKEVLMDLLWRDEKPSVASGKLHLAVSRLRGALREAGFGEGAIILEEDCYQIGDGIKLDSDVSRFDSHFQAGRRMKAMMEEDLAAAEYEAAAAIYRGPYLAESTGEDWLLAERVRLEDQQLLMLSYLADWYFDKNRFDESARCCRQILQQDNLREDIYRRLMRCLSKRGQRNQALRLYQDCSRVLHKELGIEPMRETTDLAEKIRREEPV